MGKERYTNVVTTEKLYLEDLVERDLFKDEQQLILVDFKVSSTSENNYWKKRREFLREQIEKKKSLLKKINNKFK